MIGIDQGILRRVFFVYHESVFLIVSLRYSCVERLLVAW